MSENTPTTTTLKGLIFDGQTNYAEIPVSITDSNNWSVELSVTTIESRGTGNFRCPCLFGFDSPNEGSRDFFIGIDNGFLCINTGCSGNEDHFENTHYRINDGNRHKITLSVVNGEWTLSVDNHELYTETATKTVSNDKIYIGCSKTGINSYSELSLYYLTLKNNDKVIAEYVVDDNVKNKILADVSGNGNNATLYGNDYKIIDGYTPTYSLKSYNWHTDGKSSDFDEQGGGVTYNDETHSKTNCGFNANESNPVVKNVPILSGMMSISFDYYACKESLSDSPHHWLCVYLNKDKNLSLVRGSSDKLCLFPDSNGYSLSYTSGLTNISINLDTNTGTVTYFVDEDKVYTYTNKNFITLDISSISMSSTSSNDDLSKWDNAISNVSITGTYKYREIAEFTSPIALCEVKPSAASFSSVALCEVKPKRYTFVQPVLTSNGNFGKSDFSVRKSDGSQWSWYPFSGKDNELDMSSGEYIDVYVATPIIVDYIKIESSSKHLSPHGTIQWSDDGSTFTVCGEWEDTYKTSEWEVARCSEEKGHCYWRIVPSESSSFTNIQFYANISSLIKKVNFVEWGAISYINSLPRSSITSICYVKV